MRPEAVRNKYTLALPCTECQSLRADACVCVIRVPEGPA